MIKSRIIRYEVYPIEINDKRELISKTEGIDMALLALHGQYGEDGTVQGTLDSLGIPYTGAAFFPARLHG